MTFQRPIQCRCAIVLTREYGCPVSTPLHKSILLWILAHPRKDAKIVSKKEKIVTWLSPPRLPMQALSGRLSDGHNDKSGEAQGSWGR